MYKPNPETEDLTITLSDGREIGYAVYGNPSGHPIFYFHGFPGSRIEGKMFDQRLLDSPFALYAFDRPGIGNSSPQNNRTLLTWAEDVLESANRLKIDKFTVLGISGGGPYALACAKNISHERLVACIIVSGMGPVNGNVKLFQPLLRFGLSVAKKSSGLFRLIYRLILYTLMKTEKRVTRTIRKMVLDMSPDEQAEIRKGNNYDVFITDNYYAYIQGPLGTAQDVENYARDWGFKLEDISPNLPVIVVHGEKDEIVPVEIGRNIARQISHCYSRFYPDGTHFATPLESLPNILARLMTIIESNTNT